MKKLLVAGIVALGLALTGCGANNNNNSDGRGEPGPPGYSDHDWDMNYPSAYNNMMYCNHGKNGVYYPTGNGMYYCEYENHVKTKPSKRPKPIIPPKSQQRSYIQATKPKTYAPPKSNTSYKAPSGSSYKAPSSSSKSSTSYKK